MDLHIFGNCILFSYAILFYFFFYLSLKITIIHSYEFFILYSIALRYIHLYIADIQKEIS